jgi:nucleoid DNA-binding protein
VGCYRLLLAGGTYPLPGHVVAKLASQLAFSRLSRDAKTLLVEQLVNLVVPRLLRQKEIQLRFGIGVGDAHGRAARSGRHVWVPMAANRAEQSRAEQSRQS